MRDLALKVQYPGVAESIASDVASLIALLRVSRLLPAELELGSLAPELIHELERETDYQREASAVERYRAPCTYISTKHIETIFILAQRLDQVDT